MNTVQKNQSPSHETPHIFSEVSLASSRYISALPVLTSVYEQQAGNLARLVDQLYCSGNSTINQATTELRGIEVLTSHFPLFARAVSTLSFLHRALCTVEETLSPDQFDPLGGSVTRRFPGTHNVPSYAQSIYSTLIASSRCLNSIAFSPLRILTRDGCLKHVEECHLLPFGSNPVDIMNILKIKAWVEKGDLKEATLNIRGPLDREFLNWIGEVRAYERGSARSVQINYDIPLPSGSHAPFVLLGNKQGQFAVLPNKSHSARSDFEAIVNFSSATKSETHHPFSALSHGSCDIALLSPAQTESPEQFYDFVQTSHTQLLWTGVDSLRKTNGKAASDEAAHRE